MTCARYRALISRYLDNELTPRQRTELLDHVKHCASCAADLARYRQAEVLLRKIPEGQPAPKLKTAVLREARRRRRRERHSLIWLLSAGGRANPRIVACVLAIGLLLPVLVGVLLPVASGQTIGARLRLLRARHGHLVLSGRARKSISPLPVRGRPPSGRHQAV